MQVPNAVRQALEGGAALAISISGGKRLARHDPDAAFLVSCSGCPITCDSGSPAICVKDPAQNE